MASGEGRLLEKVRWERYPIPACAAIGQVNLTIGHIRVGHPVALIVAGVHGDEGPWGALSIRRLLREVRCDELKGSLRVVPTANPLALEADARNAPLDSLDLNRVFPGEMNGSHTERLAATLVERAVKGADLVIDLHGGGSWCVNAFVHQFPGGEALSRAFEAPFAVAAPTRNVTLTGYASTLGASVVAVEMGGRCEVEAQWADRIAKGMRRALRVVGVLAPAPEEESLKVEQLLVGPTKVLRPSRGGIFVPELRADCVGTVVPGGTTLGYLLDPATLDVLETFKAPFQETAILLLRPAIAVVEGGAMTYVVAPVPSSISATRVHADSGNT